MNDTQPAHRREGLADPATDPQTRLDTGETGGALADPETDPAFVGNAPFDEERKDVEEGEGQSVPDPDQLPGEDAREPTTTETDTSPAAPDTVSDPQRDPLTEGMQENASTSLDQPSDNME